MNDSVNKYIEMNEISKSIVIEYEKCVEKYNQDIDDKIRNGKKRIKKKIPIYYSYKDGGPHIANFEEKDYVINLMGINPSISKDSRNDYSGKLDSIQSRFKLKFDNLDLYYVPKYNKEYDKKQKKKIGICDNTNFVDSQYEFLFNNVFDSYLKMSWQKYDLDFLELFYGKEKSKEYWKILQDIDKRYKSENIYFEEKYLIFTNLLYIAQPDQHQMMSIIQENTQYFEKKIKELFEKQLDYYNSNITVVANSDASKYIEKNILKNNIYEWEPIHLQGYKKYDKEPNVYRRLKGKESYVYLTARYFDRMDIFSKRHFVMDLKKIIERDFEI